MASKTSKELVESSSNPSPDCVSADYIAARVQRPRPWIESRMGELEIRPRIILDDRAYYDRDAIDLMREASDEWSARIRQSQREVAAV